MLISSLVLLMVASSSFAFSPEELTKISALFPTKCGKPLLDKINEEGFYKVRCDASVAGLITVSSGNFRLLDHAEGDPNWSLPSIVNLEGLGRLAVIEREILDCIGEYKRQFALKRQENEPWIFHEAPVLPHGQYTRLERIEDRWAFVIDNELHEIADLDGAIRTRIVYPITGRKEVSQTVLLDSPVKTQRELKLFLEPGSPGTLLIPPATSLTLLGRWNVKGETWWKLSLDQGAIWWIEEKNMAISNPTLFVGVPFAVWEARN